MLSPKDTDKTLQENGQWRSPDDEITRAEEEKQKADEEFKSRYTEHLWKEK